MPLKPIIYNSYLLRVNLIILAVFISSPYKSQIYSGANIGYNLGMAPQNIATSLTVQVNQTTRTNVKGSFGKGTSINAFAGYEIKPNLCLQLDVNFLYGIHYKATYLNDTLYKQELDLSATMLKAAPSIIAKIGTGKTEPYLKAGVLFRLAGSIKNKTTFQDLQTQIISDSHTKYNYGFSCGVVTSAGISSKINKKLKFTAELCVQLQTWSPKKAEVTKYTVNGEDRTAQLLPSQKTINFTNSYSTNANNYSGYKPNQQLKLYMPFSSIGINVGFIYTFQKKSETTN